MCYTFKKVSNKVSKLQCETYTFNEEYASVKTGTIMAADGTHVCTVCLTISISFLLMSLDCICYE